MSGNVKNINNKSPFFIRTFILPIKCLTIRKKRTIISIASNLVANAFLLNKVGEKGEK